MASSQSKTDKLLQAACERLACDRPKAFSGERADQKLRKQRVKRLTLGELIQPTDPDIQPFLL